MRGTYAFLANAATAEIRFIFARIAPSWKKSPPPCRSHITVMTKKTGLLAAAWIVSCCSAFLIGRNSLPASQQTALSEQDKAPTFSSRSASRTEDSSKLSQKGGRSGQSRELSPSSPAQLTAIKEQVLTLKEISDPVARAEGFLDLVRKLRPDQFLTAVDAFREGRVGNEQFGEYRLLLDAWAKAKPLEAIEYAHEKTGTNYARQTILATWAQNDSESAIAWAREHFDSQGEENRANPWLIGVISGLASNDFARATQLLEELPYSRGRGEALNSVYKEIIAQGPEDTKRWIAQLTDPRLKAGAAARLAGNIAQEDPLEAAQWAASLGPEALSNAAPNIINQWAEDDLSAAKEWVTRQEADVIAASAASLLSQISEKEGLEAASSWLSNYEGQPEFDNSISRFAWGAMNEQPSLAADWIMKMSDARQQERMFHQVLGTWMRNDRDGALQYIEDHPVPESIKRRASRSQ